MGVNLQRERFVDWLDGFDADARAKLLARLEHHIGQKIDVKKWRVHDDAYPRLGSYTSYNIFRLCLEYVTRGDYGSSLDEEEDVEREALSDFRAKLQPASIEVPYATHFLDSGDTDTIFIPVLFDKVFVYEDIFVASLPGAVRALASFAKGLEFDLKRAPEEEVEEGRWLPVATAKNVAKILHAFFTEKPNACVALA
jgi:hypothetical protein